MHWTNWAFAAAWAAASCVATGGISAGAAAPAQVPKLALPALPQRSAVPAPPPAPAGPLPPTRTIVMIDAAHGGDDLGGHLSTGEYEKAVTLALSVRLRSLLGARGIQVVTTRESDQSVDLNRRAEIANHAGARACISVHAAETGTGVHLFTSSLPPTTPTRFMAWKTAQSGWVTKSLALAGVLNSALSQSGMTVTLGRIPLPAVESMTCPAVAIELAPERNADHKIMAEPDDPDYQARVAATLAAALVEWRSEGRQP